MIVWGGHGTGADPINTGASYDPSTGIWEPLPTGGAPLARHFHTAIWTGTEMIVWGGLGAFFPGRKESDGGRYNPATGTWAGTGAGAPSPRCDHTAVWTGAEMIVWGGWNTPGYAPVDVSRYDPVTDAWTTIAVAGAPTETNEHTAVWTGTEMIVWGGNHPGGRFDPVLDSWTAVSTVGAPSPRAEHTTVWTGSEMIVWGGREGTDFDTGGRYDPVTDSWASTSATGAPSPRFDHTAVWTGAEMIVWGGRSSSLSNMDTGGRYDPMTDTWVATPVTGAPSGRREHTAVWTGEEMIIWGPSPSGGRYNPLIDGWVATSVVGPPTGFSSQTAVWTGAEMIVWGNGDEPVQGGRYDPGRDEWTAVPPDPPTRRGHTAVWTGAEMIVWGGFPYPTTLNTGARFCVCPAELTAHLDTDDDGHGDPLQSVSTVVCVAPLGYVTNADDCDDTDAAIFPGAQERCNGEDDDCDDVIPSDETTDGDFDGFVTCADCNDAAGTTYPGAPESNDGLDNQCPGDPGFTIVDEISGTAGFHNALDKGEYSWPAQPGATLYEVARADSPLFDIGCTIIETTAATSIVDPALPGVNAAFFYVVHPIAPNPGSWGQTTAGIERTGPCL